MSETVVHVVGTIGTDVDLKEVGGGTWLGRFRLATTPRYYDRSQRAYVDGATTWFSVQCWRSLALHVFQSAHKGDPVIVVGKLRTQESERGGRRSSTLILEATAVGHDLSRGVSSFTRVPWSAEPVVNSAATAMEVVRGKDGISASDDEPARLDDCRLADAS